MRIVFVCAFLILAFSPVASSQEHLLAVDLAQDHVDITTGFDGEYLSLFGVRDKDAEVVVVMRGPERSYTVQKKKRVGRAWLNRNSMKFVDVPAFYDYAVSQDETVLLPKDIRLKEKIGIEALNYKPENGDLKEEDVAVFQKALTRNKQASGLFPKEAKDIKFISETFFKIQFYVPSNVPTGHYVIDTFLVKDQKIIDQRVTNVKVGQVGFSAGVYKFAHSYAFAYALMIIVIAALAGWLSNAVRKKR